MQNKLVNLLLFLTVLIGFNSYSQSVSGKDSINQTIYSPRDSDSLILKKISYYASRKRYAKSTKALLNKSLTIAKKTGNPAYLCNAYQDMGNYYFFNSKLDSAEHYLLKAKKTIKGKKHPFLKASLRFALGGIYRKQGNIKKAIATVLEAKNILEKLDTSSMFVKDRRKLSSEKIILFNTLANFYNQMHENEKALAHYDKAYQTALSLKSYKYAGVILSNKGDLLLNMGKNKKALQVLKKAQKLKQKGHAQASSLNNTAQNIAIALLKLGKYQEALDKINHTIRFYTKQKDPFGLMISYEIRGSLYLIKHQYEQAIEDCKQAKKRALAQGILETQEKVYNCLYKAYKSKGNYKKALDYHQLYQQTKDSIFNKSNIKKITELEMQYTYEKEKELENLKHLSREKESKFTIFLLITGIVSLLLISGLLLKLYFNRKKATYELQEKNNQISDALQVNKILFKETHHRVKNNLQIIVSLLRMQLQYLDDEASKKIILESQNRIKSMSLIHQRLYKDQQLTGIKCKTYFVELLQSIAHTYGISKEQVHMNIDIEDLLLDVDTAIPIGLILNELISNSFKHGLTKQKNEFIFVFKKIDSNSLLLRIKDSGTGFAENFNWEKSKTYGMKLIRSLGKKLDATINFTNNNGLETTIIIKKFTLL